LTASAKKGGVNPSTGGTIGDDTFTCPLTIDADSKGALWINDYYSCEVRKYDYDKVSNQFVLERRVMGPNTTNISQFYWLPGSPPTQVWTVSDFFVRNEADIAPDGLFTNQRATSTSYSLAKETLRPFAHFAKVGDRIYATFSGQEHISELTGDSWTSHFAFGDNAEEAAQEAGLLANPGEPPMALDKAIAASGDANWKTQPWIWSDLNGNGKIDYSDDNPEFKIAFGSNFSLGRLPIIPAPAFVPRTEPMCAQTPKRRHSRHSAENGEWKNLL